MTNIITFILGKQSKENTYAERADFIIVEADREIRALSFDRILLLRSGTRREYRMLQLLKRGTVLCQISEGANQWSIDVSGGFRVRIVIALIGEAVIVVGASNYSTNQNVWVGTVAIQRLEAIVAGNLLRMVFYGR